MGELHFWLTAEMFSALLAVFLFGPHSFILYLLYCYFVFRFFCFKEFNLSKY